MTANAANTSGRHPPYILCPYSQVRSSLPAPLPLSGVDPGPWWVSPLSSSGAGGCGRRCRRGGLPPAPATLGGGRRARTRRPAGRSIPQHPCHCAHAGRRPAGTVGSRGRRAHTPLVALPHCWGCSHESGSPSPAASGTGVQRGILDDQRGHGASTKGTAELAVAILAHDLEPSWRRATCYDAALVGHSMGGMTIMSLATHRPDALRARCCRR